METTRVVQAAYNRFIKKTIEDPQTKCWEWQGHKKKSGYGQFKFQGQQWLAHRWAVFFYRPESFKVAPCVCHSCDNPSCVNPDHLFIGTYSDNAIDRESKGRGRKLAGDNSTSAKLTWDIVQSIRQDSRNGPTLAALYGVSRSTINRVKSYKMWKE